MNYRALEENITGAVRESITKLGFAPLPLTLYFPYEALCGILEEDPGRDMMLQVLGLFGRFVSERLGDVSAALSKDGRYALTIPAEGVRYVHENVEPESFTECLVKLMQEEDADIMEIASLFRSHGDAVIQRSDCEDFDYVLYFRDGKPDDYRYCFHNEMGKMIYHRFTPKEFSRFETEL